MKRQPMEWEKYLQRISKGLISKMYKEVIQLNSKNSNNLIRKLAEDLNRHFSKEDKLIANRYMKRHSMLLIIREIQIETTMRYHFTSVRMTWCDAIKKVRVNKCWWRCGRKGNPCALLVNCKLIKPLWKAILRFLKKLKIGLPHDPRFPLLSIYPKEM